MSTNQRRKLDDGSGQSVLVDGSQVGRYTVKFFTTGGMSVVYLGTFRGKEFILKEVDASNSVDVPSLLSEKGLLERLDHSGIVNYEELLHQEDHYYLVVEFVPGKPLSAWLNSTLVASYDEVMDWGIQLAEVFAYLHSQSPPIIYRDLKPGNVLLQEGRIRLIDFGIARVHKGDRKRDTALFGSIHTASPEHYGRGETDARSDIYTLGMTLYLLLTGGKVKKTGTFELAPVRELVPQVPEELDDVISRATQLEPEDRYQSALDLRDALLEAAGRPARGRIGDQTERLSPDHISTPSDHNQFSKLLVACLILIVGAAGYYFSELSDTPQANTTPSMTPKPTAVAGGHEDHHGHDHPPYGGTLEGLEEFNIPGDIFTSGTVDGDSVVLLGEDVGLFGVTGWKDYTPADRADLLAARLNGFYHQFCPICGGSKLEPTDIRVGRYSETNDTAVFYAHQHEDGKIMAGPLLLATVTDPQAKKAQTTPRFLASYWRDLLRDTVQVSRGLGSNHTVLGGDLENALIKSREQVKLGEVSTANLKEVLRNVTGKEALKLRSTYNKVPDDVPGHDEFKDIKGYEPLRI